MAASLVNVGTGFLHNREPVFKNGKQLVIQNVADSNPEFVLLRCNELTNGVLEGGGLLDAFRFVDADPAEVFGKEGIEDPDGIQQLPEAAVCGRFIACFEKSNYVSRDCQSASQLGFKFRKGFANNSVELSAFD